LKQGKLNHLLILVPILVFFQARVKHEIKINMRMSTVTQSYARDNGIGKTRVELPPLNIHVQD